MTSDNILTRIRKYFNKFSLYFWFPYIYQVEYLVKQRILRNVRKKYIDKRQKL